MNKGIPRDAKIYVAGHRGLSGSALLRRLQELKFLNIVARTHDELDLTDRRAVHEFFAAEHPDYVFLAAAKVGGILANSSYPAEFIYDNLVIQANVIDEAYRSGVRRLLFLGSSCIYPRDSPQPIKEEYLLSGPLELTNRPYAVAKIAGIEMCWSYNRQYGTRFIAAMPTNLYGPNDRYNLQTSHVLPALLRKIYEASLREDTQVTVWGTGTVRREFLHSDDMADACVFLMSLPDEKLMPLLHSEVQPPLVNVGYGSDLSIRELAELIAEVVGFQGELVFDTSKPDGTPRKLMDSSVLQCLGWSPRITLRNGVKSVFEEYQRRQGSEPELP